MRVADLMLLSTRMFRVRPSRTWLTIFGIGIGIGAVLCLVSLGYGLQKILLEKIIFDKAMLTVTVLAENNSVILTPQALKELNDLPGVETVGKVASFSGQVRLNEINSVLLLKLISLDHFSYTSSKLLSGNFFTNDNQSLTVGPDEAVVNESVLKLFGITDAKGIIGSKLRVKIIKENEVDSQARDSNFGSVAVTDNLQGFTIVGVVKEEGEPFVYLPLPRLEKNITVTKYDLAHVKVRDQIYISGVTGEVVKKGFRAQTLSEVVEQANKIFKIVKIVLGVFGAVALIVSFIGMFNTMTVALLERTGEIGIMRALGASSRDVSALFLTEAAIIGFIGGIAGIVIGIGFGELFNFFINVLASHFGGQKVQLFIYPREFLFAILGLSFLIGLISGFVPSRKAAKLDPLTALHYK